MPSAGLAQWTDPVLTSRVTPIKVVHVTELRTQINTKLAGCGQPVQAWTDNALTPRSTQIKKIHIDELRLATTNLVNAYRISQALPASPPVYTDPAITVRTTPIRAVHIDEIRGFVGGATCTPGCPAQNLSWLVSGNTCTGPYPVTANGASASAANVTAGLAGSATFQCVAGAWAGAPNGGATCAPSLDCTLNLPVGWDNGAFPVVFCYSLPLTPMSTISIPNGASHTEIGYGGSPRCGEVTMKCVNGVRIVTSKTCALGVCP